MGYHLQSSCQTYRSNTVFTVNKGIKAHSFVELTGSRSSAVECLPNMSKAQGPIPSMTSQQPGDTSNKRGSYDQKLWQMLGRQLALPNIRAH